MGAKRIARDKNGSILYYYTDHLGSTRALQQGDTITRLDYAPFGEDLSPSGGGYKFTGKEDDVSTGLYYFNARYYDPAVGRFITEDPAKDGGNWYVYCGNSPLRYVDLTGNYDRNAAVIYTYEYALSRNPKFNLRKIPLTNISAPAWTWADCTNFASQVLNAGGIKMKEDWYFEKGKYNLKGSASSYTDSWTVAQELATWLDNNSDILEKKIEIKSGSKQDDIKSIIDEVKVGDLVGWRNEDNTIHHFGIITKKENGMLFYSAHTRNRLGYSLIKSLIEDVIIFHINDQAE